jgi:Flp pilus assembly protein TadG
MRALIHKYCRYLLSWRRRFYGDRSGVVVVLVALAMPVMAGAMGLAAETSYWYKHKRDMQNAADAAAIAAATGANASTTYAAQAQAVASQLGFTNGSGNVTVTTLAYPPTLNPPASCPANKNCYAVTVSDKVPLFLSRVIGYAGNATVNNKGMTAISASSVAASFAAYPYCILALGNVTNDIDSNGAPDADLGGCNVMSDTGATCSGHNLNATIGDAYGTNNGCGITQRSNVPKVDDPYKGLAKNIPANTCGSYPGTKWTGSKSLSGNTIVCGDLQLKGNVQIDSPSNAVLVIENGQLDTNSFTLQTTPGSGLTVVFTGTNDSKVNYIPSDNSKKNTGTLDIAAPTSGPWSGVALYQDPKLTDSPKNLDIDYKGNNPTWMISGLIYLPNAEVHMSGAVNKASNGYRCFTMVIGSLLINGTANIFKDNNQCSQAGLTQPSGGNRGTLVN